MSSDLPASPLQGGAPSLLPATLPALIVAPTSGTVGSVVEGNGSGFAANSTIAFTVGGVPAASNCASEPNGSFPAAGFPPCSFTLPPVPAGPENVVATSAYNSTTVAVGNSPYDVAYDNGAGQLFVANYGDNTVTVISDSTDSIASVVSVGNSPVGVAYDSGKGQVFVTNSGDNTVSVIEDHGVSKDTVVNTTSVGGGPVGLAYDPDSGQVFVANLFDGTVSVINDTNDSVVTTISVGSGPGSGPAALAYDSATRQMFVANYADDDVSVISCATDTLVAAVPVGINPDGLAYDPGTHQVFVASFFDNIVSVVSDTKDAVVARIPVGAAPFGMAYDSGSHAIFVANSGSGNISVISDTTYTVVATIVVGNSPIGAAYDSGTGQVFVANDGDNDVSVVSPSASVVEAVATYTVTSSLSLMPTIGLANATDYAVGTGFAPESTISLDFAGTHVASTCSTDVNGSFPGSSGTSCAFTVPMVAVGSYPVEASEGTNSANATYDIAEITLTPANGTVGSSINVTGVGLPNSPIGFTIGGLGVASHCRTDATGNFPGTTGTPCTFKVPALPGGVQNVTGRSPSSTFTVAPGVHVGHGGFGVGYDPGTDQVFVANSGDATVSVISDSNDSVVATVPVGNLPYDLAYDSGKGEVFVANYGDNTVSVISDASDSVVATIDVDSGPYGVAYDPRVGQVFVSNFASGTVSVISDTTNSLVTTIMVGAGPAGIAYDGGTAQVFVANEFGNSVSVINDTSDDVTGTVAVGNSPYGIVYDAGTNQIFVSNSGDGTVSVLWDSNESVAATVSAPNNPYSDLAYDFATGQIFLSNGGSNSVIVILDTNDSVVATISVGSLPFGLAYDLRTGQVFVANEADSTMSVIDVANGVSLGGALFRVDSSIALNTTSDSADVGQTVTLLGNGYGGALEITHLSLGSIALHCTSAALGTCMAGSFGTDPSGSFAGQFVVPVVSTSGVYGLTANDSAGHSASALVTIYADPSSGTITATPAAVDVGQNATFGVTPSLGSGVYSYAWLGLPRGCRSTLASFECAPQAAGNYSVSVRVTDSDGFSTTSPVRLFNVSSDPIVALPIADVGSGTVDAGQSVNFTATATLGTGVYAYYSWSGLPTGCLGSTATVTCSGADLPAGTYSITAEVTDSNGFTSVASPTFAFTVDPDPFTTTPSATRSSADVGQSVTFSTVVRGGSGTYTLSWSGLPSGCSGGSTDTVSCTLVDSGTFKVAVEATDSSGVAATNTSLSFTVYPDPTSNLTPSRSAFDAGQSVTLTAVGTSGLGPYAYSWAGLPTGCHPSGTTATCSFPEAGHYSVRVTLTDSNGLSAQSTPVFLVVNPSVVASISETANATTVGQEATFAADANGGTGALAYAWEFGDGSTGTGATVGHVYTAAGIYVVTLWVNDTTGGSVEKTSSVTVSKPSSGSANSGGFGSLGEILAIVAALVVLGAIAGLLLLRRRQRDPASGDVPDEGPMSEEPSPSGEGVTPTEEG